MKSDCSLPGSSRASASAIKSDCVNQTLTQTLFIKTELIRNYLLETQHNND